jgi:hypothetical protein
VLTTRLFLNRHERFYLEVLMKKILATTLAIASVAVLGACSNEVETEATPGVDPAAEVEPGAQIETYVEPGADAVGEEGAADKANDPMAPEDATEPALEEPTDELPADPSAEVEGDTAN